MTEAQELQLVQKDYNHYEYGSFYNWNGNHTWEDILIESVYLCSTPYVQKEEVIGGAPEYSFEWKDSKYDSIFPAGDSIYIKQKESYSPALVNLMVLDNNGDSTKKVIEYYFEPKVGSFKSPMGLESDTVFLTISPKNIIAQGPGVEFSEKKDQYYILPNKAGKGEHEIALYPPAHPSCIGNGEGKALLTIPFTVQDYDPLVINFRYFDGEHVCFNMDADTAYTVKGGLPPYTVSIDWDGFNDGNIDPFKKYTISYTVADSRDTTIQGTVLLYGEEIMIDLDDLPSTVKKAEGPFSFDVIADIMTADPNNNYADITILLDGMPMNNQIGNNEYEIDPSSLSVGIHNLDIEAYGMSCQDSWSYSFEVINPLELELPNGNSAVACEGEIATVPYRIVGGVAPYTIAIENNGNDNTIGLLDAEGIYSAEFFHEEDSFLKVTDSEGSIAEASISVVFHAIPDIELNPSFDTTMCNEDVDIDLQSAYENCNFYNEDNNQIVRFNPSEFGEGIHYVWVEYIDPQTGCGTIDTLRMNVTDCNNEELALFISNSSLECINDDIQLNAIADGGVEPYTFIWSCEETGETINTGSSTFVEFHFFDIGDYSITCEVTDAEGSSLRTTEKVAVTAALEILAQEDTMFIDEAKQLLGYGPHQIFVGDGVMAEETAYYFNPADAGIGTHSIVAQTNPQFTACDELKKFTITVLERPEPLTIEFNPGKYFEICEYTGYDDTILVTPRGGVPFQGGLYKYERNGQIRYVDHVERKIYSYETSIEFTFEDALGNTVTDYIEITRRPYPVYQMLSDTIYEGESHTFDASQKEFAEYMWSTGEISESITVSKEGVYGVTITNEYGCSLEDTAHLVVLPVQCDIEADFNWKWISLNTYRFTAVAEADAYEWRIDDKFVSSKKSFEYTFTESVNAHIYLKVQNSQACTDTLRKLLQVNVEEGGLLSISGNVYDCCTPIPCAKVVAYRIESGVFISVDTVMVAKDGSYIVENLVKGTYTVAALPFNDEVYMKTYFVRSATAKEAIKIDLYDNATSVDILLLENTATSMKKVEPSTLKVYPNPMQEQVTVSNLNLQGSTIILKDMRGIELVRVTAKSSTVNIPRGNISSGMYTVVAIKNGTLLGQQMLVVSGL